jgi:predicted metalloprotease with PDZ domain
VTLPIVHQTHAVAKARAVQCAAVEKRSKVIAMRRLAAALAVILICGLVGAALWSRHPGLISALAPRPESQSLEVDEAIGATVEPLDSATARSLGLPGETHGAVVTSVANGGPAARAGIRTGDVVVAIDRPLKSVKDLAAGLGKDGNVLTVTLKRHGQSVIVPLTLRSLSGASSLAEEEWR